MNQLNLSPEKTKTISELPTSKFLTFLTTNDNLESVSVFDSFPKSVHSKSTRSPLDLIVILFHIFVYVYQDLLETVQKKVGKVWIL